MSRLLNGFHNSYLDALEMAEEISKENSRHRMVTGVLQSNELISSLSDMVKEKKENSEYPSQKEFWDGYFWDGVNTILERQKMMGMDSHHRKCILEYAESYFKYFYKGELE